MSDDRVAAYRMPVEFLDQLRTIEHLFPKCSSSQQLGGRHCNFAGIVAVMFDFGLGRISP
jgi:hypothetical protein